MFSSTIWQSLEMSPVGDYIAASTWAFPTLETIHVIALVTVFGSIAMMDLRLLGLVSKNTPVTAVSRETLPFTWTAFVLALITGSLLFVSKASYYMVNPYFLTKMGLIALAGINMAVLHTGAWKTVTNWDVGNAIPTSVKVAAGLSLVFWILVLFCGRVIGFTLGIYVPA